MNNTVYSLGMHWHVNRSFKVAQKCIFTVVVLNMLLVLLFISDYIFAPSSQSLTDIPALLKRIWTAQLPQEVPGFRGGRFN